MCDVVDLASSLKRTKKAVDRTEFFLAECMAHCPKETAIFGSIVASNSPSELQRSASLTAAHPSIAGFVLEGLHQGESPAQQANWIRIVKDVDEFRPLMLSSCLGDPGLFTYVF